MEEFIIKEYPGAIANALYELQCDIDFMDYEESKEQTVEDLENAIYYLKAVAENKYNDDYFRTLYRALENLVK